MLVRPREKVVVARDPDDDKVMECAVEAGADFVVTGNTRDFPLQFHGVRVVTASRFPSRPWIFTETILVFREIK